MRVHVVDPSAYTPPYDHALCRALAAAGADVELYTSRFAYGPVPPPDGYARRELFYRAAAHVRDARARRAVKLAEHVPDMLRYRRARERGRRRALPVADRAARRRPPAAAARSSDGARRRWC